MNPHDNTKSVRIDKTMVGKITKIAKSKGQTIAGYIGVNLSRHVDKDWEKFCSKNGHSDSANNA